MLKKNIIMCLSVIILSGSMLDASWWGTPPAEKGDGGKKKKNLGTLSYMPVVATVVSDK